MGFFISVEDLHFREAVQRYAELLGKGLSEVLNEQAKLLAQRLMKLTPPFSKSQGNKAVERDINRVFLRNRWFEEVFTFSNQKMQERVKSLVLQKNHGDLESIFNNSPRLKKLKIEPFDATKHQQARRGGKVAFPNPFSFPLSDQGGLKSYITLKKKNVGFAKSGWAACYAFFGGKVASWLNKSGTGEVDNQSNAGNHPFITLTNLVGFFENLDRKGDIVNRALEGRADNMIKSAERALTQAAAEAKVD